MSDRELLELAAKAAGVRKDKNGSFYDDARFGKQWLPFDDDADALRLAVKLNMHIQCDFDFLECPCVIVYGGCTSQTEKGNDPYAATRRAIVKAAAEIGKAKEE
jgi:hypothetical protein